MSDDGYAKFRNDHAAPEIRIGVKEFKCIGVSPPHDHPHIYLDMGDEDTIICPYCATLFCFDPRLGSEEADPPDCLYSDHADEAEAKVVSVQCEPVSELSEDATFMPPFHATPPAQRSGSS